MNQKILLSIASYPEPMLFCTLNEALRNAPQPSLLNIAVVDQNFDNQRAAICALSYGSQVRYLDEKPQDTLGVSWACSRALSLHDGEDYLLQIHSRMCFEENWATNLREQHSKPQYTPSQGKTALVWQPHPETPLSADDVMLRFVALHFM